MIRSFPLKSFCFIFEIFSSFLTPVSKEDKGDEHEQGGECNCYKEREPSLLLENETPKMTKTPNSGSIFKYIYQELTWGQVRIF